MTTNPFLSFLLLLVDAAPDAACDCGALMVALDGDDYMVACPTCDADDFC